MTFKESVKINLTSQYFFYFRGRASRSEFWWLMLFIALVNAAVSALDVILPREIGAGLSLAISLILLPPNLGVTVRRFHDRGLSGWWLLLPVLSLGGWALAGRGASIAMPGNLLSCVMCLVYLAILCLPSQPKANRFGPPPPDSAI